MSERLDADGKRVSAQELANALAEAWRALWLEEPRRESILVLVAQSALETGRWRQCVAYNLGNIKSVEGDGRDYCYFACNEVLNGEVKWFYPDHPACRFRAYKTLREGATDYLATLRKRFSGAWPAVLAGDPLEFVRKLKAAHYFTADEAAYERSVASLYMEFLAKVQLSPPEELTDEDKARTMALVGLSLADLARETV